MEQISFIFTNRTKPTIELLKKLNLSVIAGEYLQDINHFKNLFDVLTNISNTLNEFEILIKNALSIYENFATNINSNIQTILINDETLKRFHKSKKISLRKKIENFDINIIDLDNTKRSENELYFLFLINISLADFDEFFESNSTFEDDIDFYLEQLDKLTTDRDTGVILKTLKDKCEYFKYKINFRDYRDYSAKEPKFSENNYFEEFRSKTKNHYDKKNDVYFGNSKHINDFGNTFEYNKDNLQKISNIHQINKFYRYNTSIDKNTKIEAIDKILKTLKTNSFKNDFDKISIDSCESLLENTKLRIFLDEEKANDFRSILNPELFENPLSINENTFIKDINAKIESNKYVNYHGVECVLEFFNDLMNKLEQSKSPLEQLNYTVNENETDVILLNHKNNILSNIIEISNIYKKALEKFIENILYLRKYELKPIYMSFDECCTSIDLPDSNESKSDVKKLKLFLDSSYVLPINFETILEKSSKYKIEYNIEIKLIKSRFTSEIDTLISESHIDKQNKNLELQKTDLESRTKTIDEKQENYKDEIKKTIKEGEFKTVQIVAMFVTIATFILMNVRIFDDKSAAESLAILIGLGGVMTLFNGFFNWLIINQIYEKDKIINTNNTNRLFYVSGGLVFFSFLVLYFGKNSVWFKCNNDVLKEEIKNEIRIDLKNYKQLKTSYKDSLNTQNDLKMIDYRIKKLENKK